jgi:hypothetical protein
MLTDGGATFQAEFHKFLYENGADHRVAMPGRHKQLSSADNLCRQLGDLFNAVMNEQESITGKQSKAWIHAIDPIREMLNKYRTERLKKELKKKGVETIIRNRIENENWKRAKTFIEHFQMKKGYTSLTEISKQLNLNGYKTRKGCSFSPEIVRRLIQKNSI